MSLLALVNFIFWPIEMLNWLVVASKLHKHSGTCCTADCPVATVDSPYCGVTKKLLTKDLLLKDEIFALEKRSEDISVEPASLAPGRSVSENRNIYCRRIMRSRDAG